MEILNNNIQQQRASRKALILFTSHPTRETFRKHLGQNVDQYQDIYQVFLNHILGVATAAQQTIDFDVIVASDAADSGNIEKAYRAFPDHEHTFFAHRASSFDQKLKDALGAAYDAGYQQVAVIGNDCLDLTSDILTAAFEELSQHDTVLGPALDGGFYLLGLNHYSPAIFENIRWCGGTVFDQIQDNIHQAGQSIALLPQLDDIDNKNDLHRWLNRAPSDADQLLVHNTLLLLLTCISIVLHYQRPFLMRMNAARQIWQIPPPHTTI